MIVAQLHVYDMAEDTTAALCVQKVVRKAHLTRLAFNQHHPVLIVGDDKCGFIFRPSHPHPIIRYLRS